MNLLPVQVFINVLLLFFLTGKVYAGVGEQQTQVSASENGLDRSLVGSRDIQYEEKLAPGWKMIWDKARALSKDQKFGEALVQYELLLALKSTVDEARWEYTSVAMLLQRFSLAEEQLEILLRNDPDSPKYKLAYGDSLLASGKHEKALVQYQQLYQRPDFDKQTEFVIKGLVAVYDIQKRYDSMLPLLEKLVSIRKNDLALLTKTLFVLVELQQHEKAFEYLAEIQGITEGDIEVLRLEARLQKQLGQDDNAASTWQKIIATTPNDIESHQQLELYYRKFGNKAMELKYIELNLQSDPSNGILLSRAAELNLQMKRANRSLNYYVRFLDIYPDDIEVVTKKKEVEKIVARDLLILVENKNPQVLWEDLSTITVDRLGVFKEIAVLLRKERKLQLLADVLVIIYKEDPGNEEMTHEMVLLFLKLNKIDDIMELVPDYDKYLPKSSSDGTE